MSTSTRSSLLAMLAACATLLAPAAARAHISVHPNVVPAGVFATLNVRVPGEQEGAYAYKLDMLLPPGLTEVAVQNVPGWSAKLFTTKLAKPVETDDGPVSEEVSRVVWTGDRTKLGRLDEGTFIQFPLSLAIPDDLAGESLAFKAVQFYSNGKVDHWIGAPSSEFPAATIDITPKGGVIEDVAGGEAGPSPGEAPDAGSTATLTTSKSATGASKGLATAALVLGALGLLAGLGGIVLARRAARSRRAD
jgi:periplasmic copper chaperone A